MYVCIYFFCPPTEPKKQGGLGGGTPRSIETQTQRLLYMCIYVCIYVYTYYTLEDNNKDYHTCTYKYTYCRPPTEPKKKAGGSGSRLAPQYRKTTIRIITHVHTHILIAARRPNRTKKTEGFGGGGTPPL